MRLQNKTALVYDYGLYVKLAVVLSRSFGRVLYYNPRWRSAHPYLMDSAPGRGIEGVEHILNFWSYKDEVDCFCFPDTMDGDLQVHLREIGKRVWGSGMAETIELNRWDFKKYLSDIGMPVVKTQRVKGIDALREALKGTKDKFIKVSTWRGDFETYEHKNYDDTSNWIDAKAAKVGRLGSQIMFMIEDKIPGFEIGVDTYNVDGKFPATVAYGYEAKDTWYFGKVVKYQDLPEGIIKVNDVLSPLLKGYQYRNHISTEIRETKDGKHHFIDPCPRIPSPPGGVYMEMIKNLPEIIYYGAGGELQEPVYEGTYACEIILYSEWAKDHPMEVRFPREMSRWVSLSNYFMVDGKYFVAPNYLSTEIGSVISFGNTKEETKRLAIERAGKVEAYQLTMDLDGIEKLDKVIEEGKQYGVKF